MGDRLKLELPKSPFELVIILVGTTHPGNLGAICRCMLNYGYENLRLVNPRCDIGDIEKINIKKNITGKKIKSVEVLIKVASDNQNQN